jgi:Sulfite exporter TauE/SafE
VDVSFVLSSDRIFICQDSSAGNKTVQEGLAIDFLFFVIAFVSEIIGAVAGFGSSTIFLPLALILVDFKTALILVATSHLFGNLGRIGFFRHGLDKTMIITFGIPSILLSFIGAFIVGELSQESLKTILGIFLVIISVLFLLRPGLKFPTNVTTIITGGAISGLITGLVGTGGALRAKVYCNNSSCNSFINRCNQNSNICVSRIFVRKILLLYTYSFCHRHSWFIYWKEDS